MIQLGLSKMRPEGRNFRLSPVGMQYVPEQPKGSGYSDVVVRMIEASAAGKAVDLAGTAAVECAAGLVSRSFAAAEISGPSWAKSAISREFLGQVGRDLIRCGESLHVIHVTRDRVELLPCSSWNFEGDASPESWRVRATVYGPSSTTTRYLPYSGVVFCKWGSTPGQRYTGVGPLAFAHTSARLQSEVERSLADESSGPVASMVPVPQDGGGGGKDDPLRMLKQDIRTARGKALLVETTAAGWAEGMSASPRKDWVASRLGPNPPESLAEVMSKAFVEVLGACGISPSLFVERADGSAQRESYRRFYSATVEPLAALLASELSRKLETDISLSFKSRFAGDLAGRARAFQSLVKGGMGISEAAGLAGLMSEEG